MTTDDREVVRWYTRARSFPQLIGRTADGARLPGGPYTVAQIVAGAGVLATAAATTEVWARFNGVTNLAVLIGVTAGVVWGIGRLPPGGRNPLSVLAGAWTAAAAPRWGRLGSSAVRPRRARHLTHRITTHPPAEESR